MRRPAALAAALALIGGCASAPPEGAPPVPVPDAAARFHAAPPDAPRPQDADRRWWQRFGDPELSRWVERAVAANLELAIARERADEARALLRAAMGARRPLLTAAARIDATDPPRADSRRVEPTLALALDWDADLWGAGRWAERAAAAGALRAEHLAQAAKLSAAALTARAYLAWREAQLAQAQLADSIELQRETARLVQVRVDAGLSPQLDGLRARGELAAAEASAVQAGDAVRAASRALQELAGDARPGAPLAEPAPAALPRLQGEAPLALPIDLLRLRPDLRAAEQAWRAARADTGAADALRRPDLRLAGMLTLGSADGGARLAQLGASLAAALGATLADGGRLEAQADAARARERAAVLDYRRALQQAFAEVEAALNAAAAARARIAAQQRALQQADAAVRQSRALYTAGLAGFLDLLDAQRSALERRQALLRMQGDAARADVAVFEALGLIDAPAAAPG